MRCAACGHDEVDHEGLECLHGDIANGACECHGFEAPEPDGDDS